MLSHNGRHCHDIPALLGTWRGVSYGGAMDSNMTDRVAELRRDGIDATLLWLSGAELVTPASRRAVGVGIMRASVWQQAGVLELVECARCGDLTCDWCTPTRPIARDLFGRPIPPGDRSSW